MMRRLALTIGLVLLTAIPAAAQEQVCTGWAPAFTAGGSVFGRIAAQWNQYFAAKMDVNNGELCSPTIYNPTIIGGSAGTGITELTGPVTAGPGSGSQVTTITPTGIAAGTYTSLTVNVAGQAVAGTNPTPSSTTVPLAIGWDPALDPAGNIIANINQASTITAIVGSITTPVGATATLSVYKAPSGTACSAGTVLHSGSMNANGTASTNQTLAVTSASLSVGDRVCLVTSDASNWTTGVGMGGVTVFVTPQ